MVYPLLALRRNLLLKALGKTKIKQSAGARQRALLAEAGGQRAGCAGVSSPLAGRLVRRVRMDFERYRQSESAEQAQRLRRQGPVGNSRGQQTDMKLSYASTAIELLQECV